MTSKSTIVLMISVACVVASGSVSAAGSSEQAPDSGLEDRGRISGIVVDSVTGGPVTGAYVGIGDFGDSGGSNYSRHRKEGLFAKTETDKQGRFVLDGVAFREHPLVITHPDFVRSDMKVAVRQGGQEPDVKVSLRPAARIDITVVDSNGSPLEDLWLIRLESLDGRRFIPPGSDRHLSSFASSVWMRWPKPDPVKKVWFSRSTGFSFTELDSGEYSIDVIRFVLAKNYGLVPGFGSAPLDGVGTVYHGGIANLKIKAGQTKQIRIKPAKHETIIKIKMPADPIKRPDIPPFLLISRNVGLLLWNDGKVHGPAHPQMGHLHKNALFCGIVPTEDVFTIKNLPPGSYSVFAGPVWCMSASRMEVFAGKEVTVDVPAIQVTEQSKIFPWTFDRTVKLQARHYIASELCELVSAKTDSNPCLVVDPAIANKKVNLGEREITIWRLLEALYLDEGWKLEEQGQKELVLKTGT